MDERIWECPECGSEKIIPTHRELKDVVDSVLSIYDVKCCDCQTTFEVYEEFRYCRVSAVYKGEEVASMDIE